MRLLKAEPNLISCNTAISACEKGEQWELSFRILCNMQASLVEADKVSFNAVISACEKGEQWQRALCTLRAARSCSLRPDVVSHSAAISACEKCREWERALVTLCEMRGKHGIEANLVSVNAALSAAEKGSAWERSLGMLAEMQKQLLESDDISFSIAISACDRSTDVGLGFDLCSSLELVGSADLSLPAWTLARTFPSNAPDDRRLRVVDEALVRLRSGDFARPRELASLAAASAKLGVEEPELFHQLAAAASAKIADFELQDLLLLAWGTAGVADETFARVIQDELAGRLEQIDAQKGLTESARKKFTKVALGVAWAYNFAGFLSENFLRTTRIFLLQAAEALDVAGGRAQAPETPLERSGKSFQARLTEAASPQVVLDLDDRLVIAKPPGWEVWDKHTELQLLTFSEAISGRRWPILRDAESGHGFLHRLDVPSSGLVLAAKTYAAYFDLQLQLCSGEIARDYVVLCHGWVAGNAVREIEAHVYWKKESSMPTVAGRQGKPSRTSLKVMAHTTILGEALSLVVIRIATGRQHQIRSHMSYIGHPTVRDGKYTAAATYDLDSAFCAQNCLHRYRLAFKDVLGTGCEAIEPLPTEFAVALKSTTAKDRGSEVGLQRWLSGAALCDWSQQ
ncbi:unnamed protein product, partial [Polarella glacialis]